MEQSNQNRQSTTWEGRMRDYVEEQRKLHPNTPIGQRFTRDAPVVPERHPVFIDPETRSFPLGTGNVSTLLPASTGFFFFVNSMMANGLNRKPMWYAAYRHVAWAAVGAFIGSKMVPFWIRTQSPEFQYRFFALNEDGVFDTNAARRK